MTLLQAVLMGIIQGLTEFLPVSSSGHLALFKILFHVETDTGMLFDVLLHVGTLIAICAVYYKDIVRLFVEGICIVRDVLINFAALIKTEQTTNKIFDMVNAIAEHNQKKALDLYYDLLTLKEPSMRIMYLISRQFQILLNIKDMSQKGFDNNTMAQKAGIPPFAVRRNVTQAKGFTMQQLKQAIRDGVDFEEAVKTGRMNDQMAVELFLMKYSKQ